MSKFFRTNVFAVVCTVALVFAAAAAGVEAQSDDPILDDDILCSIKSGDIHWVVPVALQTALETHLNTTGTVESASSFVSRLPTATGTNGVRLEGAAFSQSLVQDLGMLGYTTQTGIQTQVPGARAGTLFTL